MMRLIKQMMSNARMNFSDPVARSIYVRKYLWLDIVMTGCFAFIVYLIYVSI